MEQLLKMKETLIDCVKAQMTHLEQVDAKELGEAIDMIKDLSEAIYYCTVTEAMEGKEPVGGNRETMYYPVMYYQEHPDKMNEMRHPRHDDWARGRMYYDGNGNSSSASSGSATHGSGTRGYSERDFGPIMRDQREGRSPMNRKMYMESKEMHKDKTMQLQELEKYAQELTSDIIEMIKDATPEEKTFLSNKIATLATKIQ